MLPTLRRALLLAALLLAACVPVPPSSGAAPGPSAGMRTAPAPPPAAEDAATRWRRDEARFADLVNRHRASVGCAPLVWEPAAAAVARRHSEAMVRRDFFDHVDPSGARPRDRLRAAGLDFRASGENIVLGPTAPATALAMWLRSPGHRANLEDCRWTHHGVGRHGNRWTHVFLTARS